MIKPSEITGYDRTRAELEELLLFAVVAAGKKAVVQARKLDTVLCHYSCDQEKVTPFETVRRLVNEGKLLEVLERAGMGQYKRISRAFALLAFDETLDLMTCTTGDLEGVAGIGPKTSRFFILHSRAGAKVAALDTHILKWLRASGYGGVPKATPPKGRVYDYWERAFLNRADQWGVDPAVLDLAIWNAKGDPEKVVVPGQRIVVFPDQYDIGLA